jgi:hypothetical protein
MSWIWQKPWLAAGVLAVTFAAVVGLGIGVLTTGSRSEAEAAQASAYKAVYAQAFVQVR